MSSHRAAAYLLDDGRRVWVGVLPVESKSTQSSDTRLPTAGQNELTN